MTQLSNTFEGGTGGTAISTANSGGNSGNAFDSVTADANGTCEFSTTHAAHGITSVHMLTGATKASPYVDWTGEISAPTTYGRAYVYLPALPPSNTNILRFYSAGTIVGTARVETNGAIGLLYGTGTFAGRTGTLVAPGSWFRIEFSVTTSTTGTGSVHLQLYTSPDATTATENINLVNISTGTAGNIDEFRAGFIASVTSTEMWFDGLAWSDAGPIGPSGQPKVAVLTDDFSTDDLATKWAGSYGGPTVTGGAAQLLHKTSYPALVSTAQYDATGSSIYAKITPATGSSKEAFFELLADGSNSNKLSLFYSAGTIGWSVYKAGSQIAGNSTTTYNATTHAWWRIREAGGTAYFDYSADGTSWTNLGSAAHTLTLTSADVSISAGDWASDTTAVCTIDNVNVAPSGGPPAYSGTAAVSATATFTESGSKQAAGTTAMVTATAGETDTGTKMAAGSATVAATASLTETEANAVTLTATATLSASGQSVGGGLSFSGTAAASWTALTTAGGVKQGDGTAAVTPAVVGLADTGTKAAKGTASATTATSSLTQHGTQQAAGSATVAATAALPETGVKKAKGATALAATAALASSGYQPGNVDIAAAVAVTATGVKATAGGAEFVVNEAGTDTGHKHTAGTVDLAAASDVPTAAGQAVLAGGVAVTATATVADAGQATRDGAAAVTALEAFTATATTDRAGTGVLDVAFVGTAVGGRYATGAAALDATVALYAQGATRAGSAALAATVAVAAAGSHLGPAPGVLTASTATTAALMAATNQPGLVSTTSP